MDHRLAANVGELMDAHSKIAVLKSQLATANAELVKWKVEFDVEVEPTAGTYMIIVKGSAGEVVVQQAMSQEQALYFADDVAGLTHSLAQRITVDLLTETAKEELGPKLKLALDNIVKLSSSKGFA